MSRRFVLSTAGATLLAAAAAARAGEPAPPVVGESVRVWTHARVHNPVSGTLVAADDQTLSFEVRDEPERLTIRRDSIERLRVRRGRHSRGRGALTGAAVGLTAGIVAG